MNSKSACRTWLAFVMLCSTTVLHAGPFEQGSKSLSLMLGAGRAFDDSYTIFGAGLGYYVLDGLELGLDLQTWTGGEPSITKFSPQVQYVFDFDPQFRPYLGAFFRRTSIDGFEDLDSSGARAGLIFNSGGGYYLGVGLVYENYLDCSETIFVSCDDTYSELSFTFLL